MIRAKRLRAMRRLLDYAVAESQELELRNLEQLLGAAALEIDDALAIAETIPNPHGGRQIKLVADASAGPKKATPPNTDLGAA
jgi:hypothetical protein